LDTMKATNTDVSLTLWKWQRLPSCWEVKMGL
jgi:hypothetical protein